MAKTLKQSFVFTLAAAIYIVLLGFFMNHANGWFGSADTVVSGTAAMILFTLSALVVGGLLIGKPLMLYLDGQKKEAVVMLFSSGAWLFLFFIIALFVLSQTK